MAASAFNVTEGKHTPAGFLPDVITRNISQAAAAALNAVAARRKIDPAVFITDTAVQEKAKKKFQDAMERINRHCFALDMEVRRWWGGCM
jgi:chemotaxis response regulator CheB